MGGKYGGVCGEEEGNADYGGMVQPSQEHVAPCVKVVEWGFGTRGLGLLGSLSNPLYKMQDRTQPIESRSNE